jgi:hypothetical protein
MSFYKGRLEGLRFPNFNWRDPALQVETVLSSPRTEVTELQSRKTSLALSSSYDSQSAVVQTKEWNYLDPWEFPRLL